MTLNLDLNTVSQIIMAIMATSNHDDSQKKNLLDKKIFNVNKTATPIKNNIYEQCLKGNKLKLTNKMLLRANLDYDTNSKTQVNSCIDCGMSFYSDNQNTPLKKIKKSKKSVIPSLCFYASALHKSKQSSKRSYSCNNNQRTKKNRTRPCLNKEYIDMTAKSFHKVADCFNFSPHEKKMAFALFNHESGFMLNAKSPTQARCYGQLTKDTLHNIVRNIFYRNKKDQNSLTRLYKKFAKQCPKLNKKVVPLVFRDNNDTVFTDERLTKVVNNNPVTCKITHEPDSCFFYSIFNVKANLNYFNSVYGKILGTEEEPIPELASKVTKFFKLPIELNKILVIKNNKSQLSHKTIDMTFSNNIEFYDFFETRKNKKANYDTQKVKVKKVVIFDKQVLQDMFVHYSHNGGGSVIYNHLRPFMNDLKAKISSKKICNKDPICKKHRASILKGESLKASDLQNYFHAYARRKKLVNWSQMINFTKKIQKDLSFLKNKNNYLTNYLNNIHKPKTVAANKAVANQSVASKKEQANFIKHVEKLCPTFLY